MNTTSISRRKFAQVLGARDCPDFHRLTLLFSRDYATAAIVPALSKPMTQGNVGSTPYLSRKSPSRSHGVPS
jgi:hypothetical protein